VYDERTGDVLGGATGPELMASNGEKARAAAESLAREWLSTGLLPNQALQSDGRGGHSSGGRR
jgi:hypothetical protein